MDAKTNIKARLPSRHATEGPDRALHRSMLAVAGGHAAVTRSDQDPGEHQQVACPVNVGGTAFDRFAVAEVFKRTPYIADLKRRGRDVAKDLFDPGSIPFLTKTQRDRGDLHGECMTAKARAIAENSKNVTCNPNQDVVRPADKPITVSGAPDVGSGGASAEVQCHADV